MSEMRIVGAELIHVGGLTWMTVVKFDHPALHLFKDMDFLPSDLREVSCGTYDMTSEFSASTPEEALEFAGMFFSKAGQTFKAQREAKGQTV